VAAGYIDQVPVPLGIRAVRRAAEDGAAGRDIEAEFDVGREPGQGAQVARDPEEDGVGDGTGVGLPADLVVVVLGALATPRLGREDSELLAGPGPLAVCRCFRGASRSSRSQPSITGR
jgi:hypothetical protein